MMMRKLIGLFVAIAFIAGSTAVHAIKLVGAVTDDPVADGMRSVTYAKETLLKGDANTVEASDPDDDTTYYKILRDHYVSGPADITATATESDADVYIVSYALSGMVFSEDVEAADITVQRKTVNADAPDTLADAPAVDSLDRIVAGGQPGDNSLVLRFAGTVDLNGRSDLIVLTANFAVAEGGSGSITRTVLNRTLENSNVASSRTHSLSGAIKAAPALKQVIKPNEGGPTASVAFDFNVFKPSSAATKKLVDWVGHVQLGVVGTSMAGVEDDDPRIQMGRYQHAQFDTVDQDNMNPEEVTMASDITGADTTVLPSGATRTENSVLFGGELSFVKKFALAASGDCSNTGSDLRVASTVDADVLTDKVMAREAGDLATQMYLCVAVDGETPIPETEPYTATTAYKGIPNAAFPPQGGTYELAKIRRDGTTYNIPYLTTFSEYNQRFSIVNYGSKAVAYTFEFHSEEGVTTADGMQAQGELPVGQTVLKTSDIVEITGGNRAAARLNIVAAGGTTSAAVQQVNLETRGVDTVYLR